MTVDEFDIYDTVRTTAPEHEKDRADPDIFVAGWDEVMDDKIGLNAVIIRIGERHMSKNTYLLRFEDGAEWWWDPDFMIQLSDKSGVEISDDDFDHILAE